MESYTKVSNRVSTLIINDDTFQSININDIPDGWNYVGQNKKGQHEFKHKWKHDFLNDVLIPMVGKNNVNPKHAEMYVGYMNQKAITTQIDHRLFCSNSLKIVGTTSKTSFDDVYKRMVEMGLYKTLDEAKKAYHNMNK